MTAEHSPFYWLLTFVLALGTASLVATLVTQLTRNSVSRLAPTERYRVLFSLVAMPVAFGVSLIAGVLLPSVPSLFTGVDHCGAHDDLHVHLCFLHPPQQPLSSWLVFGLLLALAWISFRGASGLRALRRGQRLVDSLRRTSDEALGGVGHLLESPEPLCITAGLWAPRVLISRGLWEQLNADQRAVVLAHEGAHQSRRDMLLLVVARALALFHLPPTRRWLLSELELAAEQVADNAAAHAIGDRLLVAETLICVARLRPNAPPARWAPSAIAFDGAVLERRVRSLVDEPHRAPPRGVQLLLLVLLALPLLGAGELHHTAESLVSLVTW